MIKLQYSDVFKDILSSKCCKLSEKILDAVCFLLSTLPYGTKEIAETKADEYADRINKFIDNNKSNYTSLELAIAAVGEVDRVKLEYLKAISSIDFATDNIKSVPKKEKKREHASPAA